MNEGFETGPETGNNNEGEIRSNEQTEPIKSETEKEPTDVELARSWLDSQDSEIMSLMDEKKRSMRPSRRRTSSVMPEEIKGSGAEEEMWRTEHLAEQQAEDEYERAYQEQGEEPYPDDSEMWILKSALSYNQFEWRKIDEGDESVISELASLERERRAKIEEEKRKAEEGKKSEK